MGTTPRETRWNVALIRDDMDLKGWEPTDLARAASVSNMTITRFFRGEYQTAKTAALIARALGKPLKRYHIPRSEALAS